MSLGHLAWFPQIFWKERGPKFGEQSFVLAKSLVTPHLAVGDSDVMFRLVLIKSILCRVRVESGLNFIFWGGAGIGR